MFSRPHQLETESDLYDAALRALMRRAHSAYEMKKVLASRTRNELLVQVVMARLKENGQLDDARFAKQFARQRSQGRKQGKFRIARDLRARGVSDRDIQAALEDSSDELAELAALRQRIDRKLKLRPGHGTGQKIDDRKVASLYRSLLRAGFPSDAIRRELKCLAASDLPETSDDSSGEI